MWSETVYYVKMKKWSSKWTQFMQLRKEAWKKFRTSTGFEPVTSRLLVRCSTNWAMKPLTLGAGQLWVRMFPQKKWVLMIYEINHIWTVEMKWKWRNDRGSERNLCNCVKKPEKNSGLFQAFLRNCINCVHCDDHFFIFISFPQFIYDLFHISFTVCYVALVLPYRPRTECTISQFYKTNCTYSIFRTIEARVGF